MIELDDVARKKVAEIRSAENIPAELDLRIKVVAGGCAGFTYDMYFDRRKAEDRAVGAGDVTILLDAASLPYLEGTKVGYDDPRGFTFDNLRAKTLCSCGASFRTFVT